MADTQEEDDNKLLYEMIDCFITEKRESNGGDLAPISESDITLLSCILDALIAAKCQRDADGYYPIEYRLVDRQKTKSLGYMALPYPTDSMKQLWQLFDLSHYNLTRAMEDFNMAYKAMEYRKLVNKAQENE